MTGNPTNRRSSWPSIRRSVFLTAVTLYIMFDFSNPHWYYSLIAGVVLVVGTIIGYGVSERHVAKNGLPDLGPTATHEEEPLDQQQR